jgi:hypothetical protein
MIGCAVGGLIYSSTVRVPLIKRCVLRHGDLKIKLSTTVLPLGHFTDPHALYCRWFAEMRVSLNINPHHQYNNKHPQH